MQRKSRAELDRLISVSEAARILGLNRSTLSRQIKQGLIRAHRGKVHLSEVREDRRNNLDVSRRVTYAAPRDEEANSSFAAARAKKEEYVAKLRELEYAVKSRRLVDAEAARRRVFELARNERDRWLSFPSRVATLIAADVGCDPVALGVVLDRQVRQHLSERSEQPTLELKSRRGR
jgi:Helix-turn-helix domain